MTDLNRAIGILFWSGGRVDGSNEVLGMPNGVGIANHFFGSDRLLAGSAIFCSERSIQWAQRWNGNAHIRFGEHNIVFAVNIERAFGAAEFNIATPLDCTRCA